MDSLPELRGYQILEKVGQGGMASVYRAIQLGLERPVALKCLLPELTHVPQFGKRFLREAKTVGQLAHTHVVPVYDVQEQNGIYYLAMEWLDGGDLNAMMKQGLQPSEQLRIIRQITLALQYAHERRLVHRDIKPDNILFRNPETAVVTDFGIAKGIDQQISDATELTAVHGVIGSPRYMSPEQARGIPLDPRSDLYSLGVLTWKMVTGNLPHEGNTVTEIALNRHENPTPKLPPGLEAWQPLCDGLLAYDREARLSDGHSVLNTLDDIETAVLKIQPPSISYSLAQNEQKTEVIGLETQVLADTTATTNTETENSKKRLANWLVLGVSVCLLLGFVLLYLGSSPQPMTNPQSSSNLVDSKMPTGIEQSAGVEPLSDPEPELRAPTTRFTPQAFFAFRDALRVEDTRAAEQFLLTYPESTLASILRVHLLRDQMHVAELHRLAEQGAPSAQLTLSELYGLGWGVNRDEEQALQLGKLAAQSGDPLARYHLGTLELARDNNERGEVLLQQAADAQFFLAQTLLANIRFQRAAPGSPATSEALALFEQAAAQGDRNALFNLGLIYDGGLGGVEPDVALATDFFSQAAQLGHPQALDYIQ